MAGLCMANPPDPVADGADLALVAQYRVGAEEAFQAAALEATQDALQAHEMSLRNQRSRYRQSPATQTP